MVLEIPVGDLLARRPPYGGEALGVCDELAQRADAVRAARDMRVQPDIHDPPALRAFRIEHVELLDQRVAKLVGGVILAGDEGEVVDFVRIGRRDDRAVGGADQIGLIVVHNVAVKGAAIFRENIGGLRRRTQ
jgi:hypothetical protein